MKKQLFALFTFMLLMLSIVPVSLADGTNNSTDMSSGAEIEVQDEDSENADSDVGADETTDDADEAEDETEVDDDDSNSVKQELREAIAARVQTRVNQAENTRAEIANRMAQSFQERYKNLDEAKQERLKEMYDTFDANKQRALRNLDEAVAEKISELDEEQAKKIMSLSKYAINNAEKLADPNVRAQLIKRINQVEELKENGFKVREIAKNRLEEAKQNYEQAKQNYQFVRNQYDDVKGRFENAKSNIEICKENSLADECADAVIQSKEYVTQTAELVKSSLEKLIGLVDASEYLTEDEIAEYKVTLQEMVNQLIENKVILDAAETFEEVRAIAKEINFIGNQARNHLKVVSGMLINNKVGSIVARADALQKRLELNVENLNAAGIDTSSLDEEITTFNEEIALAYEQYDLAKDLWSQKYTLVKERWVSGEEPEGVDELTHEVNSYMSEARDHISDAQDILKDIMNSVKDLQKEAGLTDDELEGIETDDDIEDSDDETEDEVEDTVPEDTNTSTTA